ncbi:family 18 glycoside hydrolase [Xylariaceae sp. FL0255]|nr:family 18 glycoside hydrolase [Xylariaceae sp. FL0255]
MRFSESLATASMAGIAVAANPRFVMYVDPWHTASGLSTSVTKGITHVMLSNADPSQFNSGGYTPTTQPDNIRGSYDPDTKVCLSIGGWGAEGFSEAQATNTSRSTFATAVNNALNQYKFDCVDIDWEYPGGNGQDYKQDPNSGKTDEIGNFPIFLQAIKDAIGDKELSIAVPGLQRDMIAYTAETVPQINDIVDSVNLMTYDLMNRRDNFTNHHTSVNGSLNTTENYIALGMDPAKLNLGFAFYAKYFETAGECKQPLGCPTVLLEDANGQDTGKSGAITFKDGFSVEVDGVADEDQGGQWYWDPSNSTFWTWDTPEFVAKKFDQIVKGQKLGGVAAWSLGEDDSSWTYVKAIQDGLATL